jgi:glycosyltransferase involved in cell wall biosynthesis
MFTPGNVDEFVERMEEVLSLSAEQLLDVGIGLREEARERFDNDRLKEKLLEVFE